VGEAKTMMLRLVTCVVLVLLAGCAGPIGLYHDVEGGAIAQARQPPPGADQPYPNLASIPAAPPAYSAAAQAAVNRRIAGTAPAGVSAPSPLALEGLALPGAAPPVPAIPGLVVPRGSAPPPVMAEAAPAAAQPPGTPVELAFVAGSAVLTHRAAVALTDIAVGCGPADILVGGFGGAAAPGDAAALRLAVARARRLADALTAAGVPPARISMVAAAAGSGGFVQLVYEEPAL